MILINWDQFTKIFAWLSASWSLNTEQRKATGMSPGRITEPIPLGHYTELAE